MVKSNVYQDQGDSGGVVFIPRLDTLGGSVPIGILSGGIPASNLMHFTSINNLPIVLQTGRY